MAELCLLCNKPFRDGDATVALPTGHAAHTKCIQERKAMASPKPVVAKPVAPAVKPVPVAAKPVAPVKPVAKPVAPAAPVATEATPEPKEKKERVKLSDEEKAARKANRFAAINVEEFLGNTITLAVSENPKRAGSTSAARFDLYVNGMTVAAALEAGVTAADIRWDVGHNFITLG